MFDFFLMGTLETSILQECKAFTGDQYKIPTATLKFAILVFLNNTKYLILFPTKYLWFYIQIYKMF